LLRPREEETVSDWIARSHQQGFSGLGVQPGRGRKPAFFSLSTARPRRPPPNSRSWCTARLGSVTCPRVAGAWPA
jgi:hypothetical protein